MEPTKMSADYQRAMLVAALTLDELAPKMYDLIDLLPDECERLLNTNWEVYLFAMAEGDRSEAVQAVEMDVALQEYVGILGYTIKFDKKYCVTDPQGRKHKHEG